VGRNITQVRSEALSDSFAPILAGLGLGIALAGAPGPVQAILLTEALRGGVSRGLRAMAGANLMLGALLLALALGVSIAIPSGPLLKALKLVGGAFLVFLAVDGFRTASRPIAQAKDKELPPVARGALAVILNPPAWLFLATAASSLMVSATQAGGTLTAVLSALALLVGVMAGDGTLVLASGLGLRRARSNVGRTLRQILSIVLAVLGAALILSGLLA
jgi:threonine/homoserine/homoserine lactone efflux protein